MGFFDELRLEYEDRMFNESVHPRAAKGQSNGGQFATNGAGAGAAKTTGAKTAKTGARTTAPKAPRQAAPAKPALSAHQKHVAHLAHVKHEQQAAAKKASHSALIPGGKNDPARVRELQGLLASLKIGNVSSSGSYDANTIAAVEEAQRRLGLKTINGHASASLVDKLKAAQALSPCLHSQGSRGSIPVFFETRSAMSTQDINDLPDSDFAYIEPGGQKDSSGRTVPRSLRHFPIPDAAHVRNALARIGQGAEFGDQAMPKIRKAAQKFGIELADDSEPDGNDADGRSARLAVCTRSYDFEIRSVSRDGRRLVGRVAVFNTRTRIPDRGGDFDEEIMPGFMDRSLRQYGMPVMQFDHGKDARVGTVPIGKYESFERDQRGYVVEGDLFDNPVVEPVRQAIQAQAIRGMSFRMQVTKNGDKWDRRNREVDLRQVMDADVPEAGPVVFPAYRDTAVSVRSILATFDQAERDELIRELREQAGLARDLTGRSDTGVADGGDYDEPWPWEGGESTSKQQRARQMAMLRSPIALP